MTMKAGLQYNAIHAFADVRNVSVYTYTIDLGSTLSTAVFLCCIIIVNSVLRVCTSHSILNGVMSVAQVIVLHTCFDALRV